MILVAACSALVFWGSCKSEKPPGFNPSAAESSLPAQPTRKAAEVLRHYLQLKDALVATHSKEVNQSANAMRLTLVSLRQDSALQSGNAALTTGIQAAADTLLIQLDSLLVIKDNSCEQQRIFFKPISAQMYRLLQIMEMRHIMVYRQLCPMAFNEQGAYWLSLSTDIENPYFGYKMLTCGELTDTIR